MSFDLFHRIAELDALDSTLSFDNQFQRYVSKQRFSLHGHRFAHRNQIRGVCQAWMEAPVENVAPLLSYRAEGDYLCGVFEVLSGQRVDSLMGSAGRFPIAAWAELAEKMVLLANDLRLWPEILVSWAPSTLNVFADRKSGELEIGLTHFDIAAPETMPMKERYVVGQLTRLWFYMLTGQTSESFYSLVGKDITIYPEIAENEALVSCFDALIEFDPAYRATTLSEMLELVRLVQLSLKPTEEPKIDWKKTLPSAFLKALEEQETDELDLVLSSNEEGEEFQSNHHLTTRHGKLGSATDEQPGAEAMQSWTPNGRTQPSPPVFIEQAKNEPTAQGAVTLADVIKLSGGLKLSTAILLAQKLDTALSDAEKSGAPNASSLRPQEIEFVCVCVGKPLRAERWQDWINQPDSFGVRLRPTAEAKAKKEPMGKGHGLGDLLIDRMELPDNQGQFIRLMIKMLRLEEVLRPGVAEALSFASRTNLSQSFVRQAVISDLVIARDGKRMRAAKIVNLASNVVKFAATIMLAGGLAYYVTAVWQGMDERVEFSPGTFEGHALAMSE